MDSFRFFRLISGILAVFLSWVSLADLSSSSDGGGKESAGVEIRPIRGKASGIPGGSEWIGRIYGQEAEKCALAFMDGLSAGKDAAGWSDDFKLKVVDGLAKLVRYADRGAGPRAVSLLLQGAGGRRTGDFLAKIHGWSNERPEVAGRLDEACRGVCRLVDMGDSGLPLSSLLCGLDARTLQGYMVCVERSLCSPDRWKLDRVKDSGATFRRICKLPALPLSEGGEAIPDSCAFHLFRQFEPGVLTEGQREELRKIRARIPLPADGEIMQKVVKRGAVDRYLDGTITYIGGFIARLKDVEALSSVDSLIEGLRLDYEGGFSGEWEAGILRFPLPDSKNVEIPYGKSMGGTFDSDYPFTGNGFTATRLGMRIPEFRLKRGIEIPENTRLYSVDRRGKSLLKGVYRKGEWKKP